MADYDWRQPDEKGILDSYFGSFLVLLFGALLIGYGELISYKEEVHLHQYGLMTRLDSVDPGPVTFRSHTFYYTFETSTGQTIYDKNKFSFYSEEKNLCLTKGNCVVVYSRLDPEKHRVIRNNELNFEMPDTIPHLPITEAYFKYL